RSGLTRTRHISYTWRVGFQAQASNKLVSESGEARRLHASYTQECSVLEYDRNVSRTNIDVDERLIRRARHLTGLKTKRAVINKALDLLVRSKERKGILQYYGSGIWK